MRWIDMSDEQRFRVYRKINADRDFDQELRDIKSRANGVKTASYRFESSRERELAQLRADYSRIAAEKAFWKAHA